VRRPYHLGLEGLRSPNGAVKVIELEPQCEAVAVWARRGIADPPVMVLHVEAVQLHHQLAVVDQPLILVASMAALAAEQRPIPAAAPLDIRHVDKRLRTHQAPASEPSR
jgi:hypothetical protein